MRIGIDIDGVLTDIEKYQLDYGSKYFYEKYNKRVINPDGYGIKDIFDVSVDDTKIFWDKYLYEYSKKEPAREFAGEVIKKLKDNGYEIYVITARYFTEEDTDRGKEMREIVVNWLKEQGIYYDNIIFSPEDKLEICIDNNIDLMIDDRVENIKEISSKIPVICFDALYNKNCVGKNIFRVYSWYDVYSLIMEIFNKIGK